MLEAAASAPADQTHHGPLAQILYTIETHLCARLQKIPFVPMEWVGNMELHTWLSSCMCSCSSCQMTALICWNYFRIHSGTFFHLMKHLTGQAGCGEDLELPQVCGSSLSPPAAPGAPNAPQETRSRVQLCSHPSKDSLEASLLK